MILFPSALPPPHRRQDIPEVIWHFRKASVYHTDTKPWSQAAVTTILTLAATCMSNFPASIVQPTRMALASNTDFRAHEKLGLFWKATPLQTFQHIQFLMWFLRNIDCRPLNLMGGLDLPASARVTAASIYFSQWEIIWKLTWSSHDFVSRMLMWIKFKKLLKNVVIIGR